jgi:hypothetical protein
MRRVRRNSASKKFFFFRVTFGCGAVLTLKKQIVLMKNLRIFLLLLLLPFLAFVHNIEKKDIVGSWELTKAAYLSEGKTIDCDLKYYTPVFTFREDGSFAASQNGKLYEKGHWKLIAPDTIFFYGAVDVPDNPRIFIADHPEPIISVNDSTLVLGEYICTETIRSNSIFKKVKTAKR